VALAFEDIISARSLALVPVVGLTWQREANEPWRTGEGTMSHSEWPTLLIVYVD
jgi:hypothetical protein